MRYLSLCSGVGGFELAFEPLGWELLGQCEIDPVCNSILQRHWPHTPRHNDVRTHETWRHLDDIQGTTDLVVAGAPCQPFSRAGRRQGRQDPRGNLFFNILEIADIVDTRWILLENVTGILNTGKPAGADWADIVDALDERGFDADWAVLDAQHFGVPQRRERLFLSAHRRTAGHSRPPVLHHPQGSEWSPHTLLAPWTAGPRRTEGSAFRTFVKKHRACSPSDYETWAESDIAPTLNTFDIGSGRSTVFIVQPDNRVRRLTPLECERLMAWPDQHTAYAADGSAISDTQRFTVCGNGVVSTVAHYVGSLIERADQQIGAAA